MSEIAKPADAGKWEVLRRLRYGDVLKLIRFRYGANPPDDDAARPDVMELLFLASMAPTGWEEKVRHAIELYALWMPTDEVESFIQHLSVTPHYQKLRTAEELGRVLNLTNADRERLKLWRIKPVDMTAEELAEQSKARTRDRKARARRANGVRTRAEYLAEIVKPKPWEAAGISRRQWQRRCHRVCPEMSRGEGQTILSKHRTHLATSELGESQQEGLQGGGATGRPVEVGKSEQVERVEQGSSSALRTHPATSPAEDLRRVRESRAAVLEAQWRNRHAPKEIG